MLGQLIQVSKPFHQTCSKPKAVWDNKVLFLVFCLFFPLAVLGIGVGDSKIPAKHYTTELPHQLQTILGWNKFGCQSTLSILYAKNHLWKQLHFMLKCNWKINSCQTMKLVLKAAYTKKHWLLTCHKLLKTGWKPDISSFTLNLFLPFWLRFQLDCLTNQYYLLQG